MGAHHKPGQVRTPAATNGRGRHRGNRVRRLEPYAWLGAGAITLGVGAALTAGAGVACADDSSGSAAASSKSSSASDRSPSSAASEKAQNLRARSGSSATASPKKKSSDKHGESFSGATAGIAPDSRAQTAKKDNRSSTGVAASIRPKATYSLEPRTASASVPTARSAVPDSAKALAVPAALATAAASTAVGPRHVLTGGELFLGGNYIELGISDVGSFGTHTAKPDNFVGGTPPGGNPNSIGLSYDSDGFGTGTAPALDFYVPDAPEERWSVGFDNVKYAGFSALAGSYGNAATLNDVSLTDGSTGNLLVGTFTATVDGALKVAQVHSFDANDSFYKTEVTLTNVSATTLTNVEFMRSFDPDGTRSVGGDNTTTNIIGGQFSAEGYSLVTAASLEGDAYNQLTGNLAAAFIYANNDPKATVYTEGFTNSNPYDFDDLGQVKGYTTTADDAIGIIFRGGDLAPGASVTFSYYTGVTTSDDPLAIVKTIADATADDSLFGNPGPGGIKGPPTVEQFIRGVLSSIQTAASRTLSFVTRTVSTVVTSIVKPTGMQSPTSTAKLFDRLWNLTGAGNSDGVWVDKVETSDETRFVVYIGGTSTGNSQTIWANLDSYGYKLKDKQVSAIRNAIYAAGGTIDSEVMLVGYSQGGLDAQNIAEKSNFNVTTVVTFGTPIIYGPSSRYEIIHIGAVGDPVPGLSKSPQKEQSIAAGNAYGVRTTTYNTYSSQWLNPVWEWSLHGDKNTYLQAGAAFDKYTDPKYDAIKLSISEFSGTVVKSWS